MSTTDPAAASGGHIPDLHSTLIAPTGQSLPIWTPRHIVESDRVALDDAHALSALDVPHSQGPIFTATEQAAAVGRESDAIHRSGMPLQPRSITALLRIPEPNRVVKATAGHCAPIRAPGHRM